MFLEIVSPEAVLFSSEVDSVSVPGINGEFQMLNNHAPVVSVLKEGDVKIEGSNFSIDEKFESKFSKTDDGKLKLLLEDDVHMAYDLKEVELLY